MTLTVSWLAALMTLAVLVSYEVSLAVAQRRRPERDPHEDWFNDLGSHAGADGSRAKSRPETKISIGITTEKGCAMAPGLKQISHWNSDGIGLQLTCWYWRTIAIFKRKLI